MTTTDDLQTPDLDDILVRLEALEKAAAGMTQVPALGGYDRDLAWEAARLLWLQTNGKRPLTDIVDEAIRGRLRLNASRESQSEGIEE